MTTPSVRAARLGALAGYASFLGFTAMSLDSIVHPGALGYRDAIILLPVLAFAAAVHALHRVQASRLGRFGRLVHWAVLGATVLVALGDVVHLVFGTSRLLPLFLVPALIWIVGLVAYGVVTVRARVLPAVVGLAVAASQPVTMVLGQVLKPVAGLYDFGSFSGALGNGIALLILAVALQTWAHPAGFGHLPQLRVVADAAAAVPDLQPETVEH